MLWHKTIIFWLCIWLKCYHLLLLFWRGATTDIAGSNPALASHSFQKNDTETHSQHTLSNRLLCSSKDCCWECSSSLALNHSNCLKKKEQWMWNNETKLCWLKGWMERKMGKEKEWKRDWKPFADVKISHAVAPAAGIQTGTNSVISCLPKLDVHEVHFPRPFSFLFNLISLRALVYMFQNLYYPNDAILFSCTELWLP